MIKWLSRQRVRSAGEECFAVTHQTNDEFTSQLYCREDRGTGHFQWTSGCLPHTMGLFFFFFEGLVWCNLRMVEGALHEIYGQRVTQFDCV